MANLPDPIEVVVLDYVTRGITPAALTGPMRVQLLSALGAGDAASTPIAGAVVNLGASAPAAGAGNNSNAALLRWEGLGSVIVAGYRILDSAGAPVVTVDNVPRTGGSVSVTEGVYEVPANQLVFTAA